MSSWYQGVYKVINKEKYIGSTSPIFRSSWELRLMNWLDQNQKVLRWCSECIKIPYINTMDGKQHIYYPDAYIELIDKSGKLKKFIAEIKPAEQGPVRTKTGVYVPQPPKNKNKKAMARYLREVNTYQKNTCKWQAAKGFCNRNGLEFVVLTKEDLFG